ncbi:MAG TPA: minor capsid protein [Thermaerobacter sp.]
MPQRASLTLRTANIRQAERAAAARGLKLAAEHLLQTSRAIVPIEEGTLERSGVASVDEPALRAAVAYDTPYAVRQHEDLTLRHDAGRTAKYLERPMHSERSTMLALIAAEIRRELQ